MAKFADSNFSDDGGGPDTDPTPSEHLLDDDDPTDLQTTDPTDDLPTDATNYTEPGEGDSFRGADPTVFSGNGNPEEPQAQVDQATAPVETYEQTATAPNDPSYGRQDDPDAVEQLGDEAAGDDETDDANVEEIRPDVTVDDNELRPDDYYTELQHLVNTDIEQFLDELDTIIGSYSIETGIFEDTFDIDEVIGYDDEYNMPELGEVLGSLDLNDYIGDLSNESKIIEFQDIDTVIPDLDDEYGLL